MKRKVLSILLCLCMVLAIFPVSALAEEPTGTITIDGPDEVCAQQDYEFTATPSEGVTLGEAFGYDIFSEDGSKGDSVEWTVDENGVGHGVMRAEWYGADSDGFKLKLSVNGTTADGPVSATKTVTILTSHRFVDGACEVCGLRQYTVTYDPGEYGTGDVITATKTHGEDLTLLGKTFTREGYVQTGWVDTDGVLYALGGTYSKDADMTLTPKWSGDVSTEAELKEALNEGLTFIRLIDDVKLSSTLDLSDKVITVDLNGHTLKGNIKLEDTAAAPHSILTLIDSAPDGCGVLDGNIELTRGTYGVASYLYANGGTVTGKVSLNSYIAEMFCTSDTPTAIKGYVGDYGEAHGGILYGTFNENCIKENTVTFKNGSKRYAVEVVADGSKVAAPIAPAAPEGMKFSGWYTDEALTEKYEFGSTLPESITLYAGFQTATYIVEYVGSASDPLCVSVKTYGEDLTLRGETFKREGYVQIGWVDKETGEVYALGGTYYNNADATLNPLWDEIITLTVPFTTTVKLGGNVAPGETTFDLAIVGDNAGGAETSGVTVTGSVTTNGVGDYEGELTLTGPSEQVRNLLCEGAFVQQVDAGEEGWTVDDTVYGLLWWDAAELATDDAAEEITVLILPVICEEDEDGVYYDLEWNADPLDEMTFTNTYTKTTTKPDDNNKDTGDSSNPALWFALLAVSAAGAAGTVVYGKRRRSSRAK